MTGTRFPIEIQPRLPERIQRLEELANDLLYSWDRQVRRLFYRLDRDLWERCHHNPKVFLRRVSQSRLEEAAQDRGFLEDYNKALSIYDTYHADGIRHADVESLQPGRDLVAYFCAEFGLHESFPIYSGGLGILAGDHCKAASDLGVPFVAVGLLYRQGYFTQTIDAEGNQLAHYDPIRFADLPVEPARDSAGQELHVSVPIAERTVHLKVWQAKAGHIRLYLLDSDLEGNTEADRSITYQLYGGDIHTRIQQEIALGIGGVRALRALGLAPTVWHINEGHAAFQILERCRELIERDIDLDSALEVTAAGTVFTTHTPVPAGHDIFPHDLMQTYFQTYLEELRIPLEHLLRLGAFPADPHGFNMTALALRGSRFHNGVSRIHGGVASKMESYVWPQVPPEENPITYVTNGVHLPTFLAREWTNLFDMRFSDWRNALLDPDYWEIIETIPDLRYWSTRQELKTQMLNYVRARTIEQHRRNGVSAARIARVVEYLSESKADTLVFGFARRFATYKRATLLFRDPERLARLVNDPDRPMIVIFAGKAHPNDEPGKALIREIHELSLRPEFLGKIILLEGYDMALARKLVTGVDVWLNTPEYPLEASGTSGEKAAINGVINLSVLDGWWGEGYDGSNGWAIAPHGPQFDPAQRDREEANDLLDIIEREVLPLYYERDHQGYSPEWVRLSKASMKTILPRFNAQRMVVDYVHKLYTPARDHAQRMAMNEATRGRHLARWKAQVLERWPGVHMRLAEPLPEQVRYDGTIPVRVTAHLNGLREQDVVVECLISPEAGGNRTRVVLTAEPEARDGEALFSADLLPHGSGLQHLQIRMYPHHPDLAHPFETGCMIWL
ncbi:MAG TPA: glycosyltransferase family 1 protein [Chromatiales bacterium]|nr:glycosyltransferase family 1 protein [Chromatiales bacterium]